jgi:putative inorganic carbon (hco3(-)) transporter
MELAITMLLIAPAAALAVMRSSYLIDYAIWILALNRGIRRLIDYYINGEFNPYSPVSLTPLVVGGLMFLAALSRVSSLQGRSKNIFIMFFAGLVIAFAVGLARNGLGAIYSLGEWISGLGAMLFAATQRANGYTGDRWVRSAGWAGVFVAGYGWFQYLTIPPWDAMWLEQSGMIGYMGLPEPTKMTCFSTLNERGPCAGFLTWAVAPMFLNARWRNQGGWVSVLLILSAMLLTEVRSGFIVVVLAALLQPALASGRGIGRTLTACGLVVAAAYFGLQRIPGVERFTKRFETTALAGEESSAHIRLRLYIAGLQTVAENPVGLGLGSSGMATQRGATQSDKTVFDAGYIQIFAQFGWIGALLFFSALGLLWVELGSRWRVARREAEADPFLPAARALLVSMMILLVIADVFSGFSLVWVVFGRVIARGHNQQTLPEVRPVAADDRVEDIALNRVVVNSGAVPHLR